MYWYWLPSTAKILLKPCIYENEECPHYMDGQKSGLYSKKNRISFWGWTSTWLNILSHILYMLIQHFSLLLFIFFVVMSIHPPDALALCSRQTVDLGGYKSLSRTMWNPTYSHNTTVDRLLLKISLLLIEGSVAVTENVHRPLEILSLAVSCMWPGKSAGNLIQ